MKVTCEKCKREWDTDHAKECPFCYEISDSVKNPEMIMAKAFALQGDRGFKSRLNKTKKEVAHLFAAAANMGEADAQYEYARCLEEGIGVKRDEDTALKNYHYAARQGHAAAEYRLATLLLEKAGENVTSDIAYFWLRISAEFGNPDAQYKLSHCYSDGTGTVQSPKRAIYWLWQSAESGSVTAAYEIADIFTEGKIIDANYSIARWFLAKYEGSDKKAHAMLSRLGQGIAESPDSIIKIKRTEERHELALRALREKEYLIAYRLFFISTDEGFLPSFDRLAYCYINGYGTDINLPEAKRILENAHSHGCASATLFLGDCYLDGTFGTDPEKAMSYYLSAAENGSAEAQYTLGNCYFDGKITECNIPLASKWYEKAGAQGYEDALVKMQKIHKYVEKTFNRGVDAESVDDMESAALYYKEAAEFNHAGALCNLGKCYQKGLGIAKDTKKAVDCYEKAIKAGSDIARFNLGICYLTGQGVEYSYKKARENLTLALSDGVKEAEKALSQMDARRERKMSRRIYSTSCVVYKRGEANKALQIRIYAAKRGSARAKYLIGCHYEFGIGVDANKAEADRYYRAAAAAGYNTAKTNLKRAFLGSVVKNMVRK